MENLLPDKITLQLKDAYIKKNFKYFPGEKSYDFTKLMPWSEINRILRQCRLSAPRLRLHKEGQVVPESLYTEVVPQRRGNNYNKAIEARLYEQLKEGATLIIDAIDELSQNLDQFSGYIEREFRNSVQVNAYMSWGDNIRGFETHWDDHDVLVFQIYGRKHWYLFGETRKYPLFRDLHEEEEEVPTDSSWNQIISAGDMLFIPRGHWHHAIALNEPSLHLTMGFTCRTGLEYIQWIKDKLVETDIYRQDVPALANEEKMARYNKNLLQTLEDVLTKYPVSDYLNDIDRRMENRSRFSLPWAVENAGIADDLNVSLNACFMVDYRVEEDSVKFSAMDKHFEFSDKCKPFFDKLMDFKKHSLQEMILACKSYLEPDQVRKFVTALVGQGLLTVE